MVKKSTIIFWSILASVDVGLILYSLLAHRDMYLYMKFDATIIAMLELLLSLVVINALAVLLFLVIRKRLWVVAAFLTVICVVVTLIAIAISWILGGTVFWASKTDNYEEYVGADPGFSVWVDIAGLDVDDITNREIEKVENFYYYYRDIGFGEDFKFKGEFYFSEEDYAELKEWFSNHEDLNETIYTIEEQGIYGYTGFYEFRENEPEYSAVEWDEFNISFCDEKRLIRFNVDGWN